MDAEVLAAPTSRYQDSWLSWWWPWGCHTPSGWRPSFIEEVAFPRAWGESQSCTVIKNIFYTKSGSRHKRGWHVLPKLQCGVSDILSFLLLTLQACVNSLLNLPLPVFPGHPVNCWLSTSLQLQVHLGHTMVGLFGSHITEICTELSNSGCVGDSENLRSYFQIIHS